MNDQILTALAIAAVLAAIAWMERRLTRRPERPPPRLGNRAELRRWLEQNMPELDCELGPMSLDQVRIRLNEVTGCNVQGGDSVESGSAVFLAALKKMKEAP